MTDIREILALPTAIVALTGLLLSAWTAYQVGMLGFVQVRESVLTKANAFSVECDAKVNELTLLEERLFEFIANVSSEALDSDAKTLFVKLGATREAIQAIGKEVQQVEGLVQPLKMSLSNRLKVEQLSGGLDRQVGRITGRGWTVEIASYAREVEEIERARLGPSQA